MSEIKQWFLYRVIVWWNRNIWSVCDHEYYSDRQIKVIRCEKCGDERWYDYKKLW